MKKRWYGAEFDLADATVVFEDASTPPNKVAIQISEGAVSYTEHNTMEYTNSRKKLYSVKKAEEEPMDVSLTALWEELTSTDPNLPTLEDALKFRASCANWKTVDDDPCRPPSLNMVIYLSPPCGSASAQKITLPNFRYETLTHDGSNSTIQVEGRCLAREAISEPLVLTISNVTFTPATGIVAGTLLNVKWEADYLNAEVQIYLRPDAAGDDILIGSATASTQQANVRVPLTIASGTYTVVVVNGGEASMSAESTADFTIA